MVKQVDANYMKFCRCLNNTVSVSNAVDAGKVVDFDKTSCQILDANGKPITVAMRVRNLYYLDCLTERQQGYASDNQGQQSKEDACHRRYGVRNLETLAKE